MIAAPVWAVAHAYAEGEGFAPQQASYGYGAAIGVLMRPVAIVFGFSFSFFIINIAMWFASIGLGIFLSGMLTDVVMGPISMFATLSVILGVIFMTLRYVLRMVTHLPENIPNWMGGRSNNTGDMQAAETGGQTMEGGAKMVARGGLQVKQQADIRAERKLADDAGAIEKRKSGDEATAKETARNAQMERLISAVGGGAEKKGGKDVPGD